ncbi:oxidoreductase [Paenibacillus sp. J31TS4]|uniref:oxidoreductase n=1 Tax=Paenibacillus sp. J31TS4 TaxID=2807195 RepID=UPI001B00F771|nr:oxidoreductase [Paenibacillus sp. J31TS4]GIP39405.1 oxidoreductase [Paenibacillus sp. J31TS4]
MRIVKTGLVGYGFSGSTFHAPVLASVPGLKLSAVVTSQPEKVKAAWPEAETVSTPEELLADPELELVVLATPNQTHAGLAERALAAGKHVVVDKPFTVTAEEADRLVRLADERGLVLSVYQNRRWDGDFLTVKRLVEEGRLGKVFTYESHFDRFRPEVRDRWREQNLPGSGMLYDLGSHLIDQAVHLFGAPETVYADLIDQRDGAETTDYVHLVLGYGRMRAILHIGSIVRQPGPRFLLHGDKGSFVKYGLDSQEESLKQGLRPGAPGFGEDDPAQDGRLYTGDGETVAEETVKTERGAYSVYYDAIYEALTGGGPVPVPAAEAAVTMRLIETAARSSREGRVLPFG